jgi:hypothetical protein
MSKIKIAFHDNLLTERGTSISLYDYAYQNKKCLGNESVILYDHNNPANVEEVVNKFKADFKMIPYNTWEEVDNLLMKEGCDVLYTIKAGENDGRVSTISTCKTVVHCVFHCSDPHGDVYASVSNWVPYNDGKYPCVPHMITLPSTKATLRKDLNIPEDATVFGRYGGYYQFDLPEAHTVIEKVAKEFSNIYFIFLHTEQFCEPLPNIIHLEKIIDVSKKTKFINTCDAMIHARSDGETFGLAIAEFSIKNKPVITKNIGHNAHQHMLGERGLWYTNETDLYQTLIGTHKHRDKLSQADWNAYKDYTPEKVMKLFKQIFLP